MSAEYLAVPLSSDLDSTAAIAARASGIAGVEAPIDRITPKNQAFPQGDDWKALTERLVGARVCRVHCSYWGSPTNFLAKVNFRELVDRFGSLAAVRDYYGDLTGHQMMRRWRDEYALARAIGARTYVFHLIDYATVDGAWEFTLSKLTIRRAMASILQQFLLMLDEEDLLDENSPTIEIENAGWGLEHGMQTSADAAAIFDEVVIPAGKVRIGWDLNHLLHAIGINPDTGHARFQLPDEEITDAMRELEASVGHDPTGFAHSWIEMQVGAPTTAGLNGSLHISDRVLPQVEYFRNGVLNAPLLEELQRQATQDDRVEYGYQVVLKHFDTHVAVGRGCLDPDRLASMMTRLTAQNPDLDVLHELKTTQNLAADLAEQRRRLGCPQVLN